MHLMFNQECVCVCVCMCVCVCLGCVYKFRVQIFETVTISLHVSYVHYEDDIFLGCRTRTTSVSFLKLS